MKDRKAVEGDEIPAKMWKYERRDERMNMENMRENLEKEKDGME